MSDEKSGNRQVQSLLEGIATKINNSPVLNGGFDRMMVIVQHIEEKQAETGQKVDKIHDGLYDPIDGLYARVQKVELATEKFAEKQSEHIDLDEQNMAEINESLKKLSAATGDLEKKAETTIKLKKIAGDDLEKLDSTIKVKTTWSDAWAKIIWFVVGGVGAALGKAVWEYVAHR